MSDYKILGRAAQSAADFLHAALVYYGKATPRPVEGVNAAMAAWRAKLAADPDMQAETLLDQIAALAVEASDIALAARRVNDETRERANAEFRARTEASEEAAYKARKARVAEEEERRLRRGR